MKHRNLYLLIFLMLIVFGVGAFTIKFLPDPYHEEGTVTLIEWVKREIDELLHGEKG